MASLLASRKINGSVLERPLLASSLPDGSVLRLSGVSGRVSGGTAHGLEGPQAIIGNKTSTASRERRDQFISSVYVNKMKLDCCFFDSGFLELAKLFSRHGHVLSIR